MIKLSPLVRTALFVRDLERSAAFYREVLELTEPYYEGTLDDPTACQLLGIPAGSVARALILKVAGQTMGMVGLFEIAEPPPAVARSFPGAHVGETCLVFYCADLDPVHDRLRARGDTILSPPVPLVVDGRSKQREMVFRDPDGVMINLIEWDPDEPRRPELS